MDGIQRLPHRETTAFEMDHLQHQFENLEVESGDAEESYHSEDFSSLGVSEVYYGAQPLARRLKSGASSRSVLNKKLSGRLRASNQCTAAAAAAVPTTPAYPSVPLLPTYPGAAVEQSPLTRAQYATHSQLATESATAGEISCQHYRRTIEGTCVTCGHWQQYERSHVVLEKTKRRISFTIMKEIQNLPFEDDIKEKADKIYAEINTSGVKKKSHTKAIFYCLFQAHQQLGRIIDPCWLASVVGLEHGKASKAMNYYNSQQYGGYQNVISYISPLDLIRFYCGRLRLTEETVNSIIEFYKMIAAKDVTISNRSPRPTVAAVISYYLTTNGITIDNEEFAGIFHLSFNTIKAAKRRISIVDNEGSCEDSTPAHK